MRENKNVYTGSAIPGWNISAGAAGLSVFIAESECDFCKIFVNSCVLSHVKSSGIMCNIG